MIRERHETQKTRQGLSQAAHQNQKLSASWMSERLFTTLFSGLVYPQIWEDPEADLEAFARPSGARMLTISSGGCNALSYLTADPSEVVAVDLNRHHIHLLNLKTAGLIGCPDHQSYFQFFGKADSKDNRALYQRYIHAHLPSESQAYWDHKGLLSRKRIRLFEKNIYRYGLLGRFIGIAHFLAKRMKVDLKPLLEMQTIEEQKAYFDTQVAPMFERPLMRWITQQKASLFGLGIPPQQYDSLASSADGRMLIVLRERLRKLLCDFPMQDNYFAQQAIGRRYLSNGDVGSLPPYLQKQHFEQLKARALRITAINGSLTAVLAENPEASFDAFAFLDAQDWMKDEQLNELWSQVTRTAKPGARVVFRTADLHSLLPGRLDPQLLDQWTYLEDESQQATTSDRSAIYGGVHVYEFATAT
jgi:S-adenosylmethionine-diacylglycerol 3-amino-3-carboxypropyl transferase